ncbi:hypothetical protein [Pseudobutyrivibrio sp. OR37]|uniref:hypothetical protein n=1 Tax=Pseudobutyrivibrio sp. OR37 TaxID=1798186 RepID=UPI00116011A6|nr:hypothetical protein [Pseudobutyrivibrio sp. OR37]
MSKAIIDVLNKERNQLIMEKERLEKVIVPDDGSYLEIKKNKGKYVQYYKCSKKGNSMASAKTFIRKSDLDIAKQLAQSEFDRKLYADINTRFNRLDSLLSYYSNNRISDLYSKLSPERRALIESTYLDDENYIKQWQELYANKDDEYISKYPIETQYYTEKGEHVRSKSEMIIADKLSKAGVPYVYEPACDLNKKGLHPDFAVLNITTRETYFYEHFGMMDKPEYATAAIRKIAKYRELGYEYGQKLLFTFETGGDGLSIKDLKIIIEKYLRN